VSRWIARGIGLVVGVALLAAGSSTRGLGALVVLFTALVVVVAEVARRRGSPGPDSFSRQFTATREATWQALIVVIRRLGYRNIYVVDQDREVSFNTGMSVWTWAGQDFEAVVTATPDRGTTMIELRGVTSSRGLGAIQSFSWGEAKRLGNEVLEAVEHELNNGDSSVTHAQPSPAR